MGTVNHEWTAATIASQVGGRCIGNNEVCVSRIADIGSAASSDLTFLSDPKRTHQLESCLAGIIIVTEAMVLDHKQCTWIVVDDPYLAYARAAKLMDTTPKSSSGVDDSAVIDQSVAVSSTCSIGALSVIGADTQIGEKTLIGAGCVIGPQCKIGKDVRIHANVTIYHGVEIGDGSIIHSGAVIGADGFGFANNQGQWEKIPQLGSVILGNYVEIGANTTIDRGAITNTVIGNGVKIDNMCHVAHNVEIGEHSIMAGCSAIAGSTKIGKHCMIAGGVGINGHIRVSDSVQVTGRTFVNKSVKQKGAVVSSGTIMDDNRSWKKNASRFKHLYEMERRLAKLEKIVKEDFDNGNE
ncbi:MAG: UDP-3-O-(3-hydroxymyristoyl)glucosamine N-acyltransferase [Pseudomonadota bacterium]